jgi:glycosyltransferase involved in cell wall biosynthesis
MDSSHRQAQSYKPTIAIETTYMDNRPAKGTAILIRNLVHQLVAYKDQFDITLIHKEKVPHDPIYSEFKEIIIPKIKSPKYSGIVSELWFFIRHRKKFDIYFVCYSRLLPTYLFAPAKKFMFFPMDGGPATSGYGGKTKTPFPWYIRLFKHTIDRFVALSYFGQKGIVEAHGVPIEKVPVVGCGVDARYKPTHDKAAAQMALHTKYGISTPYILCVSRWDPHKNILGIVDAYAATVKNNPATPALLFVGGRHMPDYSDQVDAKIVELGLKERISVAPIITDEDMPLVYQAAEYMVFSTFYEGFGLPVIEAMACGCPVVISDIPALVEVAHGAAHIVDPYSVASIQEGMAKISKDAAYRNDLIKKGFETAK